MFIFYRRTLANPNSLKFLHSVEGFLKVELDPYIESGIRFPTIVRRQFQFTIYSVLFYVKKTHESTVLFSIICFQARMLVTVAALLLRYYLRKRLSTNFVRLPLP